MQRKNALSALALAASLVCLSVPAHAGEKIWISLGDAAFGELQKLQPATRSTASVAVSEAQLRRGEIAGLATPAAALKGEKVHLVQIDEDLLPTLSEALHENQHRCGGYMHHASERDGRRALDLHAAGSVNARILTDRRSLATRPSYVIDQQTVVNPMLSQMQASNIVQTISDLSNNYTNRYYQTSGGVNASDWLKNKWLTMANGRTDITVEQFTHSGWKQKSVIATIKGTDNPNEIVVLGGHLDSINGSGTTETTRAPGADDDASGVASITEIYRTLLANNYKPRRTIKFMAYAAEEVGLRGSAEIANSFSAAGANVVGVVQLDMTNYKGAANDIYIFTDYTDSAQNTFVTNLIKTYLPTLTVGTDRCGYACSDHASWNAKGYATTMPFESSFSGDNKAIHTANDTLANSDSTGAHSLKFARMGLAYAVELGSDGPTTTPGDKTETFTGSLSTGQTKSFGPFKVGAGGTFKLSTTGTGDIDIYGRLGAVPTTSTYGCKSDGSTATETCTINVTANSDGYVLVKGYTAGSYTLTVTYRPQ